MTSTSHRLDNPAIAKGSMHGRITLLTSKPRAHGQSAGNRYALLLATGQKRGIHHAQARAQTFDLTRIGDLRETTSPSLARIEMPLSTW